jgi:3-deoxy-D-manno-octulosonic-acid transferase
VREQLAAAGFGCVAWSAAGAERRSLPDAAILLVDRIGLLEDFYAAGDVAFVGGSLVPHGGQNMLEPAAYGKAVVVGPHTGNFRTDVALLLEGQALVQVADPAGLRRELAALLADPQRAAAIGMRAQELIERNHGATERTLALLETSVLPATPARGVAVAAAAGARAAEGPG